MVGLGMGVRVVVPAHGRLQQNRQIDPGNI